MQFQVVNESILVQNIKAQIIGSSSMLKVGDSESIQLLSVYETNGDSSLAKAYVPIAPNVAVPSLGPLSK